MHAVRTPRISLAEVLESEKDFEKAMQERMQILALITADKPYMFEFVDVESVHVMDNGTRNVLECVTKPLIDGFFAFRKIDTNMLYIIGESDTIFMSVHATMWEISSKVIYN